ncbi:MAG: hypothetical protein OXF02_03220 [Simkaniaceae bacterium]|nr:hypothetical protein [Simkaniaceae bacterium]
MKRSVALFGEAERGGFAIPTPVKTLPELRERLGDPPKDSVGLFLAVQFLLFRYDLTYIRVEEEGFSRGDYLRGMEELMKEERTEPVKSICLPGVGDPRIIDSTAKVCGRRRCLIVTTERDLYDYLTAVRSK